MRYSNIIATSLASKNDVTDSFTPDVFDTDSTNTPSSDFVICRDIDGTITATYGDNEWDLSPWSSFEDKKAVYFNFDTSRKVAKGLSTHEDQVIEQLKFMCFALMYLANSGVTGLLGLSTIQRNFWALKRVADFCIEYSDTSHKQFRMLPSDVFSQNSTLALYLEKTEPSTSVCKDLYSCLLNFYKIGEDLMGFATADLEIDRTTHNNPTPLIPSRIYFSFYKDITDKIELFYNKRNAIERLLKEFSDPLYGMNKSHQSSAGVNKEGVVGPRPTMAEALKKYRLYKLFNDEFSVGDSKAKFSGAIRSIQSTLLMSIIFFTGMRDQEGRGMRYKCLNNVHVPVYKKGEKVESKQTVSLVSRTTKYDGYKREASWVAPIQAIRAIETAQSICRSIASLNGLDYKDCHLFINPSFINGGKKAKKSTAFQSSSKDKNKLFWFGRYVIDANDYKELQLSDEDRDWANAKQFQIGEAWVFKHHQFRRSLAFYAANSGLVSLPSIRRQFKHHSLMITRYYARNYHNMISILGLQNKANGRFTVPNYHIAHEVQTGISLAEANSIIEIMLGEEIKLFGKMGSYIERNKVELNNNENDAVVIFEKKNETLKRVKAGELKYTETLLGGCTSIKKCDKYALGDLTGCINCESAIIDEKKLLDETARIEKEMNMYDPETHEYKITVQEHTKLTQFKDKHFSNEVQNHG